MTIRAVGTLFLIPMFESKYIIKNKLEYIYKKFTCEYGDNDFTT